MILINVDEEPIKERHIAWTTISNDSQEIVAVEIVEAIYRHPQALDHAIISRIELKFKKSVNRFNLKESSHLILMESIQETVNQMENKNENKKDEINPNESNKV